MVQYCNAFPDSRFKIMYSFVGLTKVLLGLVSINPIAMDNYLNSKKVKIRYKLHRVDQSPAGACKIRVQWLSW